MGRTITVGGGRGGCPAQLASVVDANWSGPPPNWQLQRMSIGSRPPTEPPPQIPHGRLVYGGGMATLLPQVEVDAAEDAARRERFPVGAAIEFADLEAAGGERALDRLREAEPVSWLPALGGWLVTGHAAARAALSPRTATTVEAEPNLVRASLGRMMLTSDGGEHTRMRAPFERPFRMRDSGDLFGAAVAEAAADLARRARAGRRVRARRAFAAPFAIRDGRPHPGPLAGRRRAHRRVLQRLRGRDESTTATPSPSGSPTPPAPSSTPSCHAELRRSRAGRRGIGDGVGRERPGAGLTDAEIAAQLRVSCSARSRRPGLGDEHGAAPAAQSRPAGGSCAPTRGCSPARSTRRCG